jgi:16S rRNA (guanine527-N7)-methyltransferase
MQEEMSLVSLLKEGAQQFNIELEDNHVEQFIKYKDVLKDWNNRINLTAIEEDRDIMVKHFIDSLSILPYIKNEKAHIIDVGTGAGFPGIPIKIVLNSVNVTLLDSLEKRIKFLNEVIIQLGLDDIRAVHGRAEHFGANVQFREKFDVAVARAVASLPVLLEYCLPFVKVGGIFIAMKGSSLEEVSDSRKALEVLGGEIHEVKELVLPFSDAKRNIIIIKKFRQTLTKYPRKAGKPSRDPLI